MNKKNSQLYRISSYITLVVLYALLLCSCRDDDAQRDAIENFNQADITISDQGGEQLLSFTANSNWSISVSTNEMDASWCSVYPSSGGTGDQIVSIVTKENDSYDCRSVIVSLASGSMVERVIITQAPKGTILLMKHDATVYANGGTISVNVLSSVDFEVESISADWLSLSPASRGVTETTMSFVAQEYEGGDTRSAEVVLRTAEGLRDVLKVIQRGDADLINVETPGTLSELVKSAHHEAVKITGNINETDIAALNEKKHLDLSDVLVYDNDGNKLEYLPTKVEKTDSDEYINSYYCNAESIVLPDSVKYIDDYTFAGCGENLKKVVLPDSLIEIRSYSFYKCSALADISIPSRVTKIGAAAFDGCESITSLNLPNSVVDVGEGAFRRCSNLLRASLSSGIKNVESYMFYECTNLRIVTIPEGVSSIGRYAFYRCENLVNVYIPNSVSVVFDGAFLACDKLANVSLSEKMNRIRSSTFYACSNLRKIELPIGIKYIMADAFRRCSTLCSVSIPNGVTRIMESAFANCNLNEVVIPSTVTYIGESAFSYNTHLVKIEISEKVTSIGRYTFAYCLGLSEISLPDNIVSIADSAFLSCSNLESVKLPKKLETIGEYAFGRNSMLRKISVPENVKRISSYAFSSVDTCSAYPMTPPELGNNALSRKKTISELYVPKGCVDVYKNSDWGSICTDIREMDE